MTQMNLEDITLMKLASHKKINTVGFYLYEKPRVVKIITTGNVIHSNCQGLGEENMKT